MSLFRHQCLSCEAKDSEIIYLRKIIDRLHGKFNVMPVEQPKINPKKEEEDEIIDGQLGII